MSYRKVSKMKEPSVENILAQVIRLAGEKPEYRSRILPLIQKVALSFDTEKLAEEIVKQSLPILHFKVVPSTIPLSPNLLSLTKRFALQAQSFVEEFWKANADPLRGHPHLRQMLDTEGLLNVFIIALHVSPRRWLSSNNPRYLSFFKGDLFDTFTLEVKDHFRGYVTDLGRGKIVDLILDIGEEEERNT